MKHNQYILFFFVINFLFSIASIQIYANQEANSKEMKNIDPQQQMLLLNLLGGRLPLGHRMNGEDSAQVKRNVQDSLDRVLRRMRRVAEMLESELS